MLSSVQWELLVYPVIIGIILFCLQQIHRSLPRWWGAMQLWREPWRSWSTLKPEEINNLWATDEGRRQIVDSLDRDWKLPKGGLDCRPKSLRDRDKG